jgi:hypothetical protein
MVDYLTSMAISIILTVVKEAVKNPAKAASMKKALIKVRDGIDALYPEE